MSDTIEVRDPSQPCEHDGEFGSKKIITRIDRFDADTEYTFYDCGACPGGKRIVLRREWFRSSVLGADSRDGQFLWIAKDSEVQGERR